MEGLESSPREGWQQAGRRRQRQRVRAKTQCGGGGRKAPQWMCRQCEVWDCYPDIQQCYHCRAPRYAEVASAPEAKPKDVGAAEPAKAGEDDQVKIKGQLARYEKILQIRRQLAA